MVDPGTYVKLVSAALGAFPKVGRWAIRTREEHVELARMIRDALAEAICPTSSTEPSVVEVVTAVDAALDKTEMPAPTRSDRLIRAVTFGHVWRPPQQLPVDGPRFFERLSVWLGRALGDPFATKSLERVRCQERAVSIDAVLTRFPDRLEELVYEPPMSDFCERLAKMLEADRSYTAMVRRKRWELHVKNAVLGLIAAGTTYAITAPVTSTPWEVGLTAIAGLGVAGVRELSRDGVRGVRYKALKCVAEILEITRLNTAHAVPPSPELRHEVRGLGLEAESSGDPDLGDALSRLDDCLGDWIKNADLPSGPQSVADALQEVVAVLCGGTPGGDVRAARAFSA